VGHTELIIIFSLVVAETEKLDTSLTLSHMGPNTIRMTMVPQTETIELVQISCFEIPRPPSSSGNLRVERRGAIANQQKNAKKNDIQELWKPRM
jgi:hypothetical protein